MAGMFPMGQNVPYDFLKITLTGLYGRNFFRAPSIPLQKARLFKAFQASLSQFSPSQAFLIGHNTLKNEQHS